MVFSVWLSNLTSYSNEGKAKQILLSLPATENEIKVALNKIVVGKGDEYFTPDFDSPYILSLRKYLSIYENINDLNLFAYRLDSLDADKLCLFENVIEYDGSHNISELINTTYNMHRYELILGAATEADVATHFVTEQAYLDIPERLKRLMDYETIGEQLCNNLGGSFTVDGYTYKKDDDIKIVYNKRNTMELIVAERLTHQSLEEPAFCQI